MYSSLSSTNFISVSHYTRCLKEFTLYSVTSVVTAAHLSTLDATASECPVTTEVILFSHSNF